jgi:hypothetical protein
VSLRNSEDELLSGHIMCYKFMRVDNLKDPSVSLSLSASLFLSLSFSVSLKFPL